ncbi:MAG TPA: hypothetical protein DDY59_10605 [Lachnospiraceae bacterium]|jgi:hypothetical protein|nr:hypothetical protein [Lachnospiraceae bacterium]HCA69359.1 hypothetical protein [Lachnospiraceae bacterium]HCM14034.1 hypothetical protein [Lachnospiraceae bacterium]
MSNLLEQASQRVIEINKAMSEIEKFEDIISAGRDAEIAFADKGNTKYITVLSPEKMQELKDTVLVAIINSKNEKDAELERLLGIDKRKPAVINPEFEKAVQEMEQQKKPDPVEDKLAEIIDKQVQELKDKPEMTLEAVTKLYIEEGKTYREMAEYFGVNKSNINNFIYKNHLSELKQKHDCGYAKKPKQPDKKERP